MNTDNNYINEQELINTISNSTTIGVDISLLILTINKLSRYYFQKSTIYYTDDTLTRYTNNIALMDQKYVICVSLHNRIIILSRTQYDKIINSQSLNYELHNEADLTVITQTFDTRVHSIPVIIYPSNVDLKKYISILYNKILITVHSYTYEIPRTIMDMLYVEHEDFNPTTDPNSEITVHTQARHQLFWAKEYIMDLLKSDIALITDTQDRLIIEYNNVTNNE